MHASSRIHAGLGTRPSAAPHRQSAPLHGARSANTRQQHVRGNTRRRRGAARPVACRIVQAHRPYYL